ncbi:hypothetical protein B0H14DRAFT_2636242 [Mycena olivaceomarginata]|nr:hypothetical protein B0H14DRAFT_2636242 [Mycena olivaceomarginata]
MAFPWTVSTCSWLGWGSSAEEVAAKGKEPHFDDDDELQDVEEQQRAPHNHAGGAWRYRARGDMVRAKIAAIVMERQVKCELSPRSGYASIHRVTDNDEGRRGPYG